VSASTGVPPRTFHSGLARLSPGSTVRIAGWVESRDSRAVHVADSTGVTRVLLDGPEAEEDGVAREGDAVEFLGTVTENGEVRARKRTLWNRAQERVGGRIDPLSDRSYLRFRNPEQIELMRRLNRAEVIARSFLLDEEFIEVHPPLLWRAVQEYAEPEFQATHPNMPGMVYSLLQSPMPPMLLGAVGGIDRSFSFARCVRWEGERSDLGRAAEFTQLNLTLTFTTLDEGKGLFERLLSNLIVELLDVEIETPFPRIDYDAALRLYGSDSPDYRYRDYRMPRLAPSDVGRDGGEFHGLLIPGLLPVRLAERIGEMLEAHYGGEFGLVAITPEGSSSLQGRLTCAGDARSLAASYDLEPPTTLVVLPDPRERARAFLQIIATGVRPVLDPAPVPAYAFLWVDSVPFLTDPRAEDAGIEGGFHKSRSILGRTIRPSDPTSPIRVVSHDLVLNGIEVGAGGEKEHQLEYLQKNLIDAQVDDPFYRYGYHMKALKLGAPPMLNLVLGWDRLLWVLFGTETMHDVMFLPKDPSGRCAVSGVPQRADRR